MLEGSDHVLVSEASISEIRSDISASFRVHIWELVLMGHRRHFLCEDAVNDGERRRRDHTQGYELKLLALSKVSCMSIPTPSGVTVGSYIKTSEMTGCQLWRCQCFPQKLVQSQSFWWKGWDTEKHHHCIKKVIWSFTSPVFPVRKNSSNHS